MAVMLHLNFDKVIQLFRDLKKKKKTDTDTDGESFGNSLLSWKCF